MIASENDLQISTVSRVKNSIGYSTLIKDVIALDLSIEEIFNGVEYFEDI